MSCKLLFHIFDVWFWVVLSFPGDAVVKNPPANAGDKGDSGELGSIPGSGRSLRGENGNPPQYSCLGNPMVTGAWRAIVHGATKSQTRCTHCFWLFQVAGGRLNPIPVSLCGPDLKSKLENSENSLKTLFPLSC